MINEKSNCLIYQHRVEDVEEFTKLYQPYERAIEEMKNRIEFTACKIETKVQSNPIHQIASRLKTPSSIISKLMKKGYTPDVNSAKEHLTDIAGIKVVCHYIEQVYLVEEMLCQKKDLLIIKRTDYIENPKYNGYRSLHIVLKVPVVTDNWRELIPVELQFRTIAMDFWASLEHQICYKKECDHVPHDIVKRLKNCAEEITRIDNEMQRINKDLGKSCHQVVEKA